MDDTEFATVLVYRRSKRCELTRGSNRIGPLLEHGHLNYVPLDAYEAQLLEDPRSEGSN